MSFVQPYDDTCIFKYVPNIDTVLIQNASQADIDAYEWPVGLQEIILYGDNVYELHVPDGVESVTCANVPLNKLTLPDSVTRVYCDYCCLGTLELPAGVIKVVANNNWLTSVTFRGGKPHQLEELFLHVNRLVELDFEPPESLFKIDLHHNHRRPVHMPPHLARVVCKLDYCEL